MHQQSTISKYIIKAWKLKIERWSNCEKSHVPLFFLPSFFLPFFFPPDLFARSCNAHRIELARIELSRGYGTRDKMVTGPDEKRSLTRPRIPGSYDTRTQSETIDTRKQSAPGRAHFYTIPIRRAIQLRRTSHTAICNILREQSSSRDRQCMRSRASQWHLHLYWHGARTGSWTAADA